MKVKILTSIIATTLLTLSTAHALPPKPDKCPSVSALQSIALERAEKDNDGKWGAGVMRNNYDTKDSWTFVVGDIQADDESDAMNKARDAMTSLHFSEGPKPMFDMWFCMYKNDKNYVSVAVNPPLDGMRAITKLKI